MSNETKWAFLRDGKCVEVFWSTSRKAYIPIDARILEGNRAPEWTSESVFNSKQTDKGLTKVGVKLELDVQVVFDFTCTLLRTRSPKAKCDFIYVDKDDVADVIFSNSTVRGRSIVRSVKGYDGTHFCRYCEEYSATNPSVDDICIGCGHSDWIVWTDRPTYTIGEEIPSRLD